MKIPAQVGGLVNLKERTETLQPTQSGMKNNIFL